MSLLFNESKQMKNCNRGGLLEVDFGFVCSKSSEM